MMTREDVMTEKPLFKNLTSDLESDLDGAWCKVACDLRYKETPCRLTLNRARDFGKSVIEVVTGQNAEA
ncbi:hypothetical protein T265_05398 [Opisthorchis viverrini]|uniref:Uncharacterized protein n=1 Tax=Opisthorchis viverrini TaxID=6198 RepID=A0A074ZKL8_OPIVI|nr:hypothetical protein T265_05398 [Opisthorchis viverrini]KER27581.1 hypothetical protein T265_05398 [Opisthorchis viverrini]